MGQNKACLFTVSNNRLLFQGGEPVPFDNSPNWSKGKKIIPKIIVVHYTADNGRGGLNWLITSKGDDAVSAHLWIGKDGEVRQLVDFNRRAWHAGSSEWDGEGDCNSFGIGIECQGKGDEWPEAQIDALIEVLVALHVGYPTIKATVGHNDICIPEGRKPDPGPNFPWSQVVDAMEVRLKK